MRRSQLGRSDPTVLFLGALASGFVAAIFLLLGWALLSMAEGVVLPLIILGWIFLPFGFFFLVGASVCLYLAWQHGHQPP
jgi:hypothetical protein